jgi:glycosyltransferase involved in cell wall biosynthesis
VHKPVKAKSILMVQPSLQPPGGGNAVCAWILEALKDRCDITVLSQRLVDLKAINAFYGTSLQPDDLSLLPCNPGLVRLVDALPVPFSLLKTALLLRECQRIQADYDVVMSVNNEADFGRKGIQYVHFPWHDLPRPGADLRWYHSPPYTVQVYRHLCLRVAGFSWERMKTNICLVNSNWIGEKVKKLYPGIQTRTLYPPVTGNFPAIPWEDRETGFVCIGRISPEKEIEKIVAILERVRIDDPEVHLHIIGTPDDPGYFERILDLVRNRTAWISLDINIDRETLLDLIGRHRFGIHGMAEEHFGMAVAEMTTAGCIVFVPNGGGQTEIVGACSDLLYRTPDDALKKIKRVLPSRPIQDQLRTHLLDQASRFSVQRFTAEINEIVRLLAHEGGNVPSRL